MTPTDPPPAPPRFARPLPQVSALSYATAPKAHTYRAIIQIVFEAKQHYLIELRPQEVLDRLRQSGLHFELQDPEDVEPELSQLVAWGNLKDAHDTGSVSRLEDFYRHRLLYHLTAVGEAAHRAALEVEATVGKTRSRSTVFRPRGLRCIKRSDRNLDERRIERYVVASLPSLLCYCLTCIPALAKS